MRLDFEAVRVHGAAEQQEAQQRYDALERSIEALQDSVPAEAHELIRLREQALQGHLEYEEVVRSFQVDFAATESQAKSELVSLQSEFPAEVEMCAMAAASHEAAEMQARESVVLAAAERELVNAELDEQNATAAAQRALADMDEYAAEHRLKNLMFQEQRTRCVNLEDGAKEAIAAAEMAGERAVESMHHLEDLSSKQLNELRKQMADVRSGMAEQLQDRVGETRQERLEVRQKMEAEITASAKEEATWREEAEAAYAELSAFTSADALAKAKADRLEADALCQAIDDLRKQSQERKEKERTIADAAHSAQEGFDVQLAATTETLQAVLDEVGALREANSSEEQAMSAKMAAMVQEKLDLSIQLTAVQHSVISAEARAQEVFEQTQAILVESKEMENRLLAQAKDVPRRLAQELAKLKRQLCACVSEFDLTEPCKTLMELVDDGVGSGAAERGGLSTPSLAPPEVENVPRPNDVLSVAGVVTSAEQLAITVEGAATAKECDEVRNACHAALQQLLQRTHSDIAAFAAVEAKALDDEQRSEYQLIMVRDTLSELRIQHLTLEQQHTEQQALELESCDEATQDVRWELESEIAQANDAVAESERLLLECASAWRNEQVLAERSQQYASMELGEEIGAKRAALLAEIAVSEASYANAQHSSRSADERLKIFEDDAYKTVMALGTNLNGELADAASEPGWSGDEVWRKRIQQTELQLHDLAATRVQHDEQHEAFLEDAKSVADEDYHQHEVLTSEIAGMASTLRDLQHKHSDAMAKTRKIQQRINSAHNQGMRSTIDWYAAEAGVGAELMDVPPSISDQDGFHSASAQDLRWSTQTTPRSPSASIGDDNRCATKEPPMASIGYDNSCATDEPHSSER